MKPALLTVLLTTIALPARADEVVQLLDGTRMSGRVVHYFDGVLTITSGGQEMKIPKDKIRSIAFELPQARPELGTPEKTFDRWRQALLKGDLTTMIDCYGLMYQGLLSQQMADGQEEDFRRMREEVKQTKFQVKGSSAKGDAATLKVVRQKGEDIETAELRFVRENGEWKMVP